VSEYSLDWLCEDAIDSVEASPFRFTFRFRSGGTLKVSCPWRVVAQGVQISSEDHDQQYGLPAPLDAALEATALLRGHRLASVVVAEHTADIRLTLDNGFELQIIPFSSGYEAWESFSPDGFHIVAQGGGQLTGFDP
jgi:hypothetical protein